MRKSPSTIPAFSPPDGQLAGDSGPGTPYTLTNNQNVNAQGAIVGNQITGIQIGGRTLQLGARLSF